MVKVKRVQNKQQHQLPLKEYNLKLDLDHILKNILNKEDQYTIPIFIPHLGCNNECVFCNQRKITGLDSSVTIDDVENIINEYLEYFKDKVKDKKVEVAFFGGSFTGIPIQKQEEYLKVANRYLREKVVDSIRISTRPDYITPKILFISSFKLYSFNGICCCCLLCTFFIFSNTLTYLFAIKYNFYIKSLVMFWSFFLQKFIFNFYTAIFL